MPELARPWWLAGAELGRACPSASASDPELEWLGPTPAVADESATLADERGPAEGEARFLDEPPAQKKPESKGRIKFKRFLNRFGVPGASLLGPLAIPTQITSTILVSSGVKTSWILLWQGIAIVVWTTLTTLIATGALSLFTG